MSGRKTKKVKGLYKRPGSPYWYMRYSVEGRLVWESTGTKEKKLAEAILAKRRTDVTEGRFLDKKVQPKVSFSELCDRYWEKKGRRLKMKGLHSMVAAWKSFFGNVRANDITQSRVEDFLVAYIHDKGLSESTRNRHIAMLKAMFNWAMKEKSEANKPPLVTRNPLANMKPTSEKHLRRTRYLDPDEIDALLVACKDDFRPLVVTALHTGMRRGEIFSLRWEDLDFRSCLLRVKDTKGAKMFYFEVRLATLRWAHTALLGHCCGILHLRCVDIPSRLNRALKYYTLSGSTS